MAVPRQMTAHSLEAPKGWPSPHAVDFAAIFNVSDLGTLGTVFAGSVVHLNDDGEFIMGIDDTDMAIFLFNNSDDPDVDNPGGDPALVSGAWIAIAPTGKMMGLVACGAYELASTEFKTALTYLPNQTLTAPEGTTSGTSGTLTNASAVPYTNPVCGVVSRKRDSTSATNSHGVAELFFWPVYLPIPA
jgi:hypothetical protein